MGGSPSSPSRLDGAEVGTAVCSRMLVSDWPGARCLRSWISDESTGRSYHYSGLRCRCDLGPGSTRGPRFSVVVLRLDDLALLEPLQLVRPVAQPG